jgi:hypothetical protein
VQDNESFLEAYLENPIPAQKNTAISGKNGKYPNTQDVCNRKP